jgi:hypothetical protein
VSEATHEHTWRDSRYGGFYCDCGQRRVKCQGCDAPVNDPGGLWPFCAECIEDGNRAQLKATGSGPGAGQKE